MLQRALSSQQTTHSTGLGDTLATLTSTCAHLQYCELGLQYACCLCGTAVSACPVLHR